MNDITHNPASKPVNTRWLWFAVFLLTAASAASVMLAWRAEQRGASLEQELVRRQQDSAAKVTEARTLAKQAQEGASDAGAKLALLEVKVSEVAVHRGQLEELVQSLSRSRDDNLLIDLDAALRVAMQQSTITGSVEPLVATLKQSDERLARYNLPRLEGVRRAVNRDLDRTKAISVTDIASLSLKLDEAIRTADELPLVGGAASSAPNNIQNSAKDAKSPDLAPRPASGAAASSSVNSSAKLALAAAQPAASAASGALNNWSDKLGTLWSNVSTRVWGEVKSLVRVSRIDYPEAMLLSPEQAFFVRENFKLRLLNARLAIMSRQFDTAQTDLQAATQALERYFDRNAKRTVVTTELMRQLIAQARQVNVPRPDDTLAAIAAVSAGR
jgi:uroporphyrin-III C-methyltransferase